MNALMEKTAPVLHYEEWKNEGDLMLFLHGIPNNHLLWSEQVKSFKERFHILSISLPGTFLGEEYPDDVYEIENLLGLIKKRIDRILTKYPQKRLIFVGHDLGCFLLENLAELYPESVRARVHISGMGLNQYAARKFSLLQWLKSSYITILHLPGAVFLSRQFFKSFIYKTVYSLSGIKNNSNLLKESHNGLMALPLYLKLAKKARKLLFKKNKNIPSNIPTLMIFGEDEKFLNLPDNNEVAHFYKNAELKIMKGGHWLLRQYPLEVNRVIEEFLKNADQVIR